MKVTHFALFSAVCLLFVIGRPDKVLNRMSEGPSIQEEERQEEQYYEEASSSEIRVTFKVSSLKEESVADIIWLKKAAELALENGSAYFNITDQNISRRFVRKENVQLSVIDGYIKLENDPMTAEYDAHEIAELVLTDYSL
ncbi:MAG TPA: hypothetical protein VNJ08_01360 [Bacteriovoracaceae bacterium]|nr:hypothetical protein [Bacteriovoracaceae bacterium]